MIRYLWLGVAIAAAYILSAPGYDLVPSLFDGLVSGILSSDYAQLLRSDPLIEAVGEIATGAVILTFMGFTIVAAVESVLVAIAHNRIRSAFEDAGPKMPFTKARLQDVMSHAPFLHALTEAYVRDLVPVHAERKSLVRRGKEGTSRYETLEALRSADEFLGAPALVDRRAFLWLFAPIPAILWGLGVVAAALALSRPAVGAQAIDWNSGALAAATAFSLAGAGAVLSTLLVRPLLELRRIQANRFAADIDQLLRFRPATIQLHDLQVSAVTQSRHIDGALKTLSDSIAGTATANGKGIIDGLAELSSGVVKSLGRDIEKAIATPLKALTDAASRLSEDQSAQIQQVLRATLKAFVVEIEKHVGSEIKESQALVKAAADQAARLEKSFADANKALVKQAKAQANDFSRALDKAVKSISDLDKANQTTVKTGLATAARDLATTADKLKTLSTSADKLVASVKPALDDVGANQKALLEALKSQDDSSKVIGSAATDLKAASKASKELIEAFVGLAEKLRQATTALKNGGSTSATRPETTIEIGKGLRQLRERTGSTGKGLPKL